MVLRLKLFLSAVMNVFLLQVLPANVVDVDVVGVSDVEVAVVNSKSGCGYRWLIWAVTWLGTGSRCWKDQETQEVRSRTQ